MINNTINGITVQNGLQIVKSCWLVVLNPHIRAAPFKFGGKDILHLPPYPINTQPIHLPVPNLLTADMHLLFQYFRGRP